MLPVEGHEDKSVDRNKGCDNDKVLHRGAPQISKGPSRRQGIINSSEWNTEQNEKQIRQLNQENIDYTKLKLK